MADSPPPSSGSTLYNTDLPSAGNYSGRPVDASNVDAQNGPTFPIPTFYSAPRTTKHTLMGIRAAEGHSQRANDPFDYEQKYPEDEEYQEMGPMARIWKVFLDECGKFDSEMVENWRDALDVLLVFAGLFSAVVTTFVSQTCQNLQPDFQEINTSKMNEVSELIRAAILNGTEGVLSIPRSTNTAASFRPSLSALWVNGLWFTSLALSLTTALIAVLTKQWIHQYMSVPSGTPRDRSRIRQFRYMSLQQWQVPVIIGLLPVLMHVSLGVFFTGLTIFLCSLNTAIAGVIGSIAAAAFGVYITTNLLPLFKPGCPYKTPLTFHSHSLSHYLWRQFQCLMVLFVSVVSPDSHKDDRSVKGGQGRPLKELRSLEALEKERVDCDTSCIDTQCLSWLFNVSSNLSVQRVVMQAISNLPLQDTGAILTSIPSLKVSLTNTMTSIEERVSDRPVYDRLFRSLSRFDYYYTIPYTLGQAPGQHRLSVLAHRSHSAQAAEYLRAQIINPTARMDVLSWAKIMTNALHDGIAWLDVNREDSDVWRSLVPILLVAHTCSQRTNCDRSRKKLITVQAWQSHRLTILDADRTNEAFSFRYAIETYMRPSFLKLILDEYDSSLQPFPPELPSDIALQLSLMPSPSVRTAGIWTEELWQCIEKYVGVLPAKIGGHTVERHPEIVRPMFHALLNVVRATDFVETLTSGQKLEACLFLLRTLHMDPGLQQYMDSHITPAILQKILGVAFAPGRHLLPSPLITDILNVLEPSRSPLVANVYEYLRERQWLEEVTKTLSSWHDIDIPRHEDHYDLSYPFLACAYVKGLRALKYVSPAEYRDTLDYLTPPNLLRLSKLVLLADTDSRQNLWTLANVAGSMAWAKCGEDLATFLASEGAKANYDHHASARRGRHPFNDRLLLSYGTYHDLSDLLGQTIHHQATLGKTVQLPLSNAYPPMTGTVNEWTAQREMNVTTQTDFV